MQTYQLQQLNAQVQTNLPALVAHSELRYQTQLDSVGAHIAAVHQDRPLVLVNGASSAGKTTTADRIIDALARRGVQARRISMDDYYVTRSASMPYDEENNVPDWESPLCMDLELLARHLQYLAQGREIHMPHYDFTTGTQTLNVTPLHLDEHEVAVIEGIHAFNPVITGELARFSSNVWLSPDAEVVDGARVYDTATLRFARRAVRDAHFRNAPLDKTVAQWKSVRRGERLYIHPYCDIATLKVDTYLPYESGILYPMIAEQLRQNEQAVIEAGLELALTACTAFTPVDYAPYMPENSLLREFVGM